jgi:hypothetical protein
VLNDQSPGRARIALVLAGIHGHDMEPDWMSAIRGLDRWSCRRCARPVIRDVEGRIYGDALWNECTREQVIRDYLLVGGTIREAFQAAAESNLSLRDWDWLPRFQPLSYYRHVRKPYDPRPVRARVFR